MDKIKSLCSDFLNQARADNLAFAIVDFNNSSFESFELSQEGMSRIHFDYASLTKPLVNSILALGHQDISKDLKLLLNHRAGLPSWGVLERETWKDYLMSFPVKESETLYSDFSALRFMLEMQKLSSKKLEDQLKSVWDEGVIFWKNLKGDENFCQNGYRLGKPVRGEVHDPNAYNLAEFTSHAGLFGTVDALANTLLNMNKKFDLLKFMAQRNFEHRFVWGFDTASPEGSLAGDGHSRSTFGHLGFTGTSFWIDASKGVGNILLTNATKEYWFDKVELNELRRELGAYVWENY